MVDEETTEIHIKQALSSSKVIELMDKYPNLNTITCSKSVYNRIPKKYIEALDSLDIKIKIDYKWGNRTKKNNEFLKSKVVKLFEEGLSAKEIANQLEISLNRVYYLLKRSDKNFKFNNYNKKYDDNKRNKVFSMKEEGKSPKIISNELDIPLRSVYYILNKK